jgi:hypothetical protein
MSKKVPFTATFLAVKLLDIGLVTVYFFVFGLIIAKLFDGFIGGFDEKDYKDISVWWIAIEIIFQLIVIGIVCYGLRNIVSNIPFPLDGVGGFDHSRLKELEGGEVLIVVLIMFQKNFYEKVSYFINKVFNRSYNLSDVSTRGEIKL